VWSPSFATIGQLWILGPSRSRKADARGTDYVRIIPQNTNFIYNNFV
jgi:hypothetical protein